MTKDGSLNAHIKEQKEQVTGSSVLHTPRAEAHAEAAMTHDCTHDSPSNSNTSLLVTPQNKTNKTFIKFTSLIRGSMEKVVNSQRNAFRFQSSSLVGLSSEDKGIVNPINQVEPDVEGIIDECKTTGTSMDKPKVTGWAYWGLCALVGMATLAMNARGIVGAFCFPLRVNSQETEESEKEATDKGNRWQIIELLALLVFHMKLSSCIVVAAQDPLMKQVNMNLFDYNVLLGTRCIPGLLASLFAISLQRRFGSSYSLLALSLCYLFASALQAAAIAWSCYKTLVLAGMLIEGCNAASFALSSAITASLVHGDEQSRAVTLVSIYAMLGMVVPLITLPRMVEYAGVSYVAGGGSVFGGILAVTHAFAFSHVSQGCLALDESTQNDPKVNWFSIDFWRQGQALCLVVAMAIHNGTAICIGENITNVLSKRFCLNKEEIGLATFTAFVSCVAAQCIGILLDNVGYRPVASILASGLLALTILVIIARTSAIASVVLWGVGYSLNVNAGYSSFALIVPDEMLPQMMGLTNASMYAGFITVPLIYGFFEQQHTNFGFFSLLALLAVVVVLHILLSSYNCLRSGASLYGTQKYDDIVCSVLDHLEPTGKDQSATKS